RLPEGSARFFFDGLLQGGNGGEAFCDGLLNHALVDAVNHNLIYGVREVALRLHDAQDRPDNLIVHVPLAEMTLGVLDQTVEALALAFPFQYVVVTAHRASAP